MLLLSALFKSYKYCNIISKDQKSFSLAQRPDNKLENLLNNLG